MTSFRLATVVLGLLWCAACAPKLGDSCNTNSDCSINGDRFCDTSQPAGYCTIRSCEPGSCGSEGRCVRFQPDDPRLWSDWCMARCKDTGDCDRGSYVCRNTRQLNEVAEAAGRPRIAEVLDDNKDGKFCVVKNEDDESRAEDMGGTAAVEE